MTGPARVGPGPACLACGATVPIEGHVVWNAPLRFKPLGMSGFRRGERVLARACGSCGRIELRLENTPGPAARRQSPSQ